MTDKPVFGDAPTASLGIPRFDIAFPETVFKSLGDFAQAVPVFAQRVDEFVQVADKPKGEEDELP